MTDAEIRAAMASLWIHRLASERDAEARFERLALRLDAISASQKVVALAHRAVEDEARHGSLCAELVRYFGVEPPAGRTVAVEDLAPAGLSEQQQILYEVVAFSCITETMNAALLTVSLAHVRDPPVRRATQAILKDEVQHSRLGWAHAAWEHERASCAWLGKLLPRILQGAATDELRRPRDWTPDAAALLYYGSLPRPMRIELFRASLCDVIFPGLEACGVPCASGRAWLAQALGPTR